MQVAHEKSGYSWYTFDMADERTQEQREQEYRRGLENERRQRLTQNTEQSSAGKQEENSDEQQRQEPAQNPKSGFDPQSAVDALATGGQIAGRTTQVAAKGVEVAAKGTEAISKGVKKGGQALTRSGAELSGTGLGAIAGVPMMIAGGAMTAGGAVGEGLSKGAQKGAQSVNQFGSRVAEGSKDMKRGSKGTSPLEELGNESLTNLLKRELTKTKKAAKDALHGDVGGVVDAIGGEAANFALARALSLAWEFLIPTFGLSLIWINIHFVAHYFFHSDKFCAFGDEWSKKGAKMIPGLEYVEIMGLIALDLLAFVVILVVTGVGAGLMKSIFSSSSNGGSSGGAGASGEF